MTELLSQIPIVWAKIITMIIFVGLIVWLWTTPKEYILKSSPDKRIWRDLRIWGTLIIISQIVIYFIF